MNRHIGRILPHALKNLVEKPVTVSYPENRDDVFTNIRGKLVFDAEKCVGCKLCVRDCPAAAIKIEEVEPKQYRAVLLMDRCIFCGQCVDSCNKAALQCSPEFEVAGFDRESMETEI